MPAEGRAVKNVYSSLGKSFTDDEAGDIELQSTPGIANLLVPGVQKGSSTKAVSSPPAQANSGDEKLFWGYPRKVWVGTYVGGISVLVNHLIFSYLKFTYSTMVMAILYIIPLLIIVLGLYVSHLGLRATEPDEEEPPGSWDVTWLLMGGFVVYQCFLWAILTTMLQLDQVMPSCEYSPEWPFTDDNPEAVWFPFNNYQSWFDQSCSWKQNIGTFRTHAMLGPIILMLGCFNFFKFSRNVVFDIFWHRWVGRIHNVLITVCALSGAVLSTVSATPIWIEAGFVILGLIWLPSALIGWYFIYFERNIIQHKRWMTRMFACTATAISLRLYKVLGGEATPYWVCVWGSMCQLPIVEYYLQESDDCDRVFLRCLCTRAFSFQQPLLLQMPENTAHSEAEVLSHHKLGSGRDKDSEINVTE